MIHRYRHSEEERQAVREIFNLSSVSSSDESFARWTEYYFRFSPEWIYLYSDGEGVAGYLTGCADSAAARDFYCERIRSYDVFADLFGRFPAHLHINLHPRARGAGAGSKLIQAFFSDVGRAAHIVTSPDQRNRAFYQRNGFTFEVQRDFNQFPLLFMGRE